MACKIDAQNVCIVHADFDVPLNEVLELQLLSHHESPISVQNGVVEASVCKIGFT